MRDDQLNELLRRLEDDRGPDPAFAGALFHRLTSEAQPRPSARSALILLAATLLLVLAAGLAIGSGILRLPVVVDANPSAPPSVPDQTSLPSSEAAPSESLTAAPSPTQEPSLVGRILAVQVPEVALRRDSAIGAEEVAVLRTGQRMGVVAGPTVADGMEWYEVRIGPGDLSGWVASGPDRTDLALVEDGAVAASCADPDCPDGPGVYVADLEDGGLAKLAGNPMWLGVWSPDGAYLAVTSAPLGTVALLDADGNPVVGPKSVAAPPAWSPDSRQLAWSTGDGLMVAGLDLEPVQLLTMDETVRWPAWSPDGTRLAFVQRPCPECDAGGRPRPPGTIWVVGADGTDLQPLLTETTDSAEWTPDGRYLALSVSDATAEGATLSLWRIADGLVTTVAEDLSPGWAFWSPDGANVAYTTHDALVVADGDGSNPRTLLELPAIRVAQLRWAPGGGRLLVEIVDAEDTSIRIIDVTSGEVRDVDWDAPYFSVLMWQPRLVPLP
jgi:dipeptidyl aminopeptidase/acylaminoacyl peptidase